MKNPFDKFSPRTIRIIYSVAALFVLLVGGDRFLQTMIFRVTSNDQCAWLPLPAGKEGLLIESVVKGGVADEAGIMNGDTLLKVNGYGFKTTNEPQARIDSLHAGEYAVYTIKRGSAVFDARVRMGKIFDVRFLAFFLLGFGFSLVGYVVVMTKPQGQIQRMFARYGMMAFLLFALLAPAVDPARDPRWKIFLINSLFIAVRVLGQPLLVSFFLHFPVRKLVLKRRWIKPSLYAVSILSVVAILLFVKATAPIFLVSILVFLVPLYFFAGGLIVFAHSYFRNVEPSRRNQLRPMLYGIGLGLAAILYLIIQSSIDSFAIFLNPVLVTPVLFVLAVPLTFGYSIFRYRLMDIDLLIERSLIYGAVTATLAAIYIAFVFGIGSVLSFLLGQSDSKLLSAVAFVVIAFVFDPLKRRVQESIDRIFYRERRNYQKALLEFSQELPRQMNLEQTLTSMVQRISATMHVEKVAVVLCDQKEGCFCINKNIAGEYCNFIDTHEGLIQLLKETRSPQSFALLVDEPESVRLNEEDREKILRSGVVLAVPMLLQDRLIGTINVGPKLSGKIYSQEDIDLLSTVASQGAIAIENSRLHKSEIEKQKIEEELTLARRIQEGLLPKSNPAIEGLDIAGISIPALTVGGDYFDYITFGAKKVLIIVADVSGKGMSASLYMSKVQGMVQLAAQMYQTPRDILVNVNRRLYEGMERKSFITMILAMFDMDRREVRICRAGHHRVLIKSAGGIRSLPSKGIGLGLEKGPLFESELEELAVPITPGTTFVFYSDGLTEAMDEHLHEFGEQRIEEIVRGGDSQSSVELQNSIIRSIQQFQGNAEQHDDMTLVIVRA